MFEMIQKIEYVIGSRTLTMLISIGTVEVKNTSIKSDTFMTSIEELHGRNLAVVTLSGIKNTSRTHQESTSKESNPQ